MRMGQKTAYYLTWGAVFLRLRDIRAVHSEDSPRALEVVSSTGASSSTWPLRDPCLLPSHRCSRQRKNLNSYDFSPNMRVRHSRPSKNTDKFPAFESAKIISYNTNNLGSGFCTKKLKMDQAIRGITGITNKLDNTVYPLFVNNMKRESPDLTQQFAIALLLVHPIDQTKFLAVKRPSNAKSLPDVWGLPAVTLNYSEPPEIAMSRVAKEKLNTEVELLGCLGLDSINRGNYYLTLMDIVVKLKGKEPSVIEAQTKHTKYIGQQWTDEPSILKEAASKGSLCSRILLKSLGIAY